MQNLGPNGFLRIGASELEYRMIATAHDAAPTIMMLHEGLGSVGLWGDFPEKLQAATGAGFGVRAPLGPETCLRADLGFPLNPSQNASRQAAVLYLNLTTLQTISATVVNSQYLPL